MASPWPVRGMAPRAGQGHYEHYIERRHTNCEMKAPWVDHSVWELVGLSVLAGLASAECRLPESLHFTECDVILGVVRARSVHKIGYGHNRDWSAA